MNQKNGDIIQCHLVEKQGKPKKIAMNSVFHKEKYLHSLEYATTQDNERIVSTKIAIIKKAFSCHLFIKRKL